MKRGMPKIIVILGPTASGKSDLGIRLAKKFNGEIISADSRQVYRGMDIGTGKVRQDRTLPVPNSKFKNQNAKFRNHFYSSDIRHHLINITSPKKQFTTDDFKNLGRKAINDIISRGKTPIIVGGTGFYIDVLLGRMSIAKVPPNKKLRARLDKLTVEHLFKMLQKLDPQRAKTIESKNKRRLIRALEIVLTTGKPVPKPIVSRKYKVVWIGLKPKNIKQRIKKRLDLRLKQGMIKEVKNLLKSGVSKKRLYSFGLEYKWLTRYLNKEINYEAMKENLLRDIIRYSKRQMTWFTRPNFVERNLGGFKRNKDIHWVKNRKEAEDLIKRFNL